MTIPLSSKISSAANVVGPFAPSKTALHYNLFAFDLFMLFSTAAGIK